MDPLRLAVGTLTAIPVPAPRRVDRRVAGAAMLLAPVAVLPLAVLAAGVVALGEWLGVFALLTAVLAIAAGVLGSRAMHVDGLADTADGLSAGYDRARALEVMRRGDTGPSGVAAVVLVLLGQVAALAGAIAAGGMAQGVLAAACAVLASRLVLALCCVRGVPAARPGGLGATVAGSVPPWAAAAVLAAGAGLAGAAGLLAGLPLWRSALAVVVGVAAAGLLLARCVRRLGGITGDVLGGCIEVAALGVLVSFAV